ncbi:MAG: hypothetical protein ABMA25_06850 [Ilumatobacteraceae bacterium]
MTDLETRLRATYTAVAEQTSVAPWSELPDTDVVELRPAAVSTRHARVGWWAAAAAFLLLAGAVGVARLRSDPVTAPAGTDRPFAIPMVLPTGFGLVDWSTDETLLPGFGDVPTDAAVASLDYLGPGGEIHVRSTEAFGDPITTPRSDTLSTGLLVHTATDGTTTTLAWVADSGAAVSLSAVGVELDELLTMAEAVWYATPKRFAAATATGGFGSQTFERWQPPGDRFDGSELRLEGSLQDTYSHLSLGFFCCHGFTPGVSSGCFFQTSSDGEGHVLLFGPPSTTTFVVSLPDGSVRRQPAGSPPWFSANTFAMIEVDDPGPDFDAKDIPVSCEVTR